MITLRFEATFGFPPGENVLVRTEGSAGQSEVATLADAGVSGDLLDLYAQVEKVSLPDAGNGFFIHPPMEVAEGFSDFQPTKLVGAKKDDIIVFGSDGGGGLFAASASSGGVYRLEGGSLIGQTYEADESEAIKVADDLWGFLEYFERQVVEALPRAWI